MLLALIAEKLVGLLEPVMETVGLRPEFVGVTILAVVPNTAEFVNGLKFALQVGWNDLRPEGGV